MGGKIDIVRQFRSWNFGNELGVESVRTDDGDINAALPDLLDRYPGLVRDGCNKYRIGIYIFKLCDVGGEIFIRCLLVIFVVNRPA